MGWRAIPAATIALPLCLIAELLPIRSYSTAGGLAADHINYIAADSRGFVWFCTPEGLLESLAAGTDGTLWIGTQVGIVRSVAGSPGVFRIMTRAQGLIDRQVAALATDRSGNMWAGTGVCGFGESHRRCSSSHCFGRDLQAFGERIRRCQVPRPRAQSVCRPPHVGTASDPVPKPYRRVVGGDEGRALPLPAGEGGGSCMDAA